MTNTELSSRTAYNITDMGIRSLIKVYTENRIPFNRLVMCSSVYIVNSYLKEEGLDLKFKIKHVESMRSETYFGDVYRIMVRLERVSTAQPVTGVKTSSILLGDTLFSPELKIQIRSLTAKLLQIYFHTKQEIGNGR